MAIEQTLVFIKPKSVEKQIVGEIITRYEKKGLKLVALKLVTLSEELAKKHYEEHKEKSFFGSIVASITSSSVVAMVWEAPEAVAIVRLMNGATNGAVAQPGTIRGDFAIDFTDNVVHASDSVENAKREIALFFPELG